MGGIGSGGQNRKSARLHKIQGTYRKDRHGGRGTLTPIGEPQKNPPRWLTPEAKRFWREYAPLLVELGTLDAISQMLFAALCTTWSDLRSYDAKLEEQGHVVETSRGNQRLHPLVSAKHKAEKRFLDLAGVFGMTPISRKRLGIEPVQAEDESRDNPFLQTFSMSSEN